jgi:arabinose-5-phosphate isomerase
MSSINEIDRVIGLEIETLVKLREHIGESYDKVVDLIIGCQGKVVVTGVGKSGLVAQKISATMVSTGTPALFLHAGDGLHGDVGIIRAGDLVLALSKSGETQELLSILPYIKSIQVPVVSITADESSSLATGSDLVLYTPVDEEACPFDLAPTSSTTAALVVGDALAMAVMKRRNFTPEHFAVFHPGGKLGKQLLLTIKDTMRSGEENPAINIDSSVSEMLFEISNKRCGAVSIVDEDGKLLGLVTDFDIRKVLERRMDFFNLEIKEIMNADPSHVFPETKALDALRLMEQRDKPFLVMPVVEQASGKVVGMVHLHDLVALGI